MRDAGWRGDAELMRLGYTAAVALRWFVAPGTLRLLVDTQARTDLASAAGMPEGEFVQERLALLEFALDGADEARRLASGAGAYFGRGGSGSAAWKCRRTASAI